MSMLKPRVIREVQRLGVRTDGTASEAGVDGVVR